MSTEDEARKLAQETATVVDPLLADVWAAAWALEDREQAEHAEGLAALLRMAYLQGYGDALTEEVRGEVFSRLGVKVPPLKPAAARRTRSA